MVESSSEKKRIFYIIVLLLTLVVMIIGATLAYYRLIDSQKKDNTKLYTGTLKINYIDGVYIQNPELFPASNVDYNTYDNVYRNNFEVVSSGSLNQIISIDLIVSSNTFSQNALKYALYSSKGNLLSKGYVPNEGKINLTNNIFLGHGERAKYTLIMWWDNTGFDQKSEMGSTISGKISIDAIQVRY